jgi:hypothetical protein
MKTKVDEETMPIQSEKLVKFCMKLYNGKKVEAR